MPAKIKSALKEKGGINARDRLLEAGVDIFGKYGFESATTRMIARQAGANIAAIPYYFSGKEGLYLATVAHIVKKIEAQLASTFRDISEKSSGGGLTRESALALLETLLGKLINFMVGSPEAPRFARIILREQLYPSFAYDIIFNRMMNPMITAIAGLVTAASEEVSPRVAKLRAMTFIGQVMAFRVARETAVRALGLEGYSAKETAEIRRVILEQTRASIEALHQP